MSGANNDADRLRLQLERIQTAHLEAHELLLASITRLAQRARTHDEAEILDMLIAVRAALRRAREGLAELHPDACERPMRSRD